MYNELYKRANFWTQKKRHPPKGMPLNPVTQTRMNSTRANIRLFSSSAATKNNRVKYALENVDHFVVFLGFGECCDGARRSQDGECNLSPVCDEKIFHYCASSMLQKGRS